MRRTLLAFLTAILLLAGFSLPAYGAEDPGGRLEVLIRMDYRESPAVLLERGLTLTLTGRESGSAAVTLTGKDTKESLDLGGFYSGRWRRGGYHLPQPGGRPCGRQRPGGVRHAGLFRPAQP